MRPHSMKVKNLVVAVLIAGAAFGMTAAKAATFILTFTQVGTPGNGPAPSLRYRATAPIEFSEISFCGSANRRE